MSRSDWTFKSLRSSEWTPVEGVHASKEENLSPWLTIPLAIGFVVGLTSLTLYLSSTTRSSSSASNAYVQSLYGMTPSEAGAADVSKFSILYREHTDSFRESMCQGSVSSSFNVHAPVRVGAANSRGVEYHMSPRLSTFSALESGSFAEVKHCGGSKFETNSTWHYVMNGSGMFVNIGKTISFRTHDEAAEHFLGHGCQDRFNTDWKFYPECDEELHDVMVAAAGQGYNSLQFLGHCDAYCGFCGHELVILGYNGGETCAPGLQYYSRPGVECSCIEWGESIRGACAMCSSTAEALDRYERERTWPPQRTNVTASWKKACSLEEERQAALQKVTPNSTCSTMEDCLASLERTIAARGSLSNRARVVAVDEDNFDICTEFEEGTRFCELGYGEGGPIAKKSCLAPSSCYRFNLKTILAWAKSMKEMDKSRKVCNIVMRGHTMACSGIERTDGHTIVYGHEGYTNTELMRLKYYMWYYRDIYNMIGTSHSGGVLLTYALMKCSKLNVFGMGLYSNKTDFIYQHYYDNVIHDTCVTECWKGDSILPNSTSRDREFFQKHSDQVCRPHTTCDAPQSGVPATENQIDFFLKSELKLHILHAFGVIDWHL